MPNANIALKSIVERYRGMSDFRPTETRFESLKPKNSLFIMFRLNELL